LTTRTANGIYKQSSFPRLLHMVTIVPLYIVKHSVLTFRRILFRISSKTQ